MLLNTLNKETPSLLHPYKVKTIGDLHTFITDKNLEYTCSFTNLGFFFKEISPLLAVHDIKAYDFSFYPSIDVPKKLKSRDERIAITIKDILCNFFLEPLRFFVYTCYSSPTDDRANERQFLFKSWQKDFKDMVKIFPMLVELKNDKTIIGGLVTKKDFPFHNVLQTEVLDKAKDIMLEKYES